MPPTGPIYPFEGILPTLGAGVFVHPAAVVIGDVVLGEETSVWPLTVIRGDVMPIRIGARVNLQDACVVHVTGGRFSTTLEDEVSVGHGVILHGCVVRRGALVGMGARVLDGCEVGEESLVGAGALLPPGFKVPPRTLVIGAPAQVKRDLRPEELEMVRNTWKNYVALKERHRKELV